MYLRIISEINLKAIVPLFETALIIDALLTYFATRALVGAVMLGNVSKSLDGHLSPWFAIV